MVFNCDYLLLQVVTLIGKMERLRGSSLQSGIHCSVAQWHEAVTSVQEKRRDEVVNAITQRHNPLPNGHSTSEQGLYRNVQLGKW